jgi:hypothetical protein
MIERFDVRGQRTPSLSVALSATQTVQANPRKKVPQAKDGRLLGANSQTLPAEAPPQKRSIN